MRPSTAYVCYINTFEVNGIARQLFQRIYIYMNLKMTACYKTIKFVTSQWTWELRIDPALPSGCINEITWYIQNVISWECHGQIKSQKSTPVVLNSFYNLLMCYNLRVTQSFLSDGTVTNDVLYNERNPRYAKSQWIRLRSSNSALRTVLFSLSIALRVLCVGFAVMVAPMVPKLDPGKSGFSSNFLSNLDRSYTLPISLHTTQRNPD